MQEQPDSAPHSRAHSGRPDGGCSGPSHQLPHAQKYMLLNVMSQQLEAGQIEHVMQHIKDELGPGFLEQHADLLFELQRCNTLSFILLPLFRRCCLRARTASHYPLPLYTLQSSLVHANPVCSQAGILAHHSSLSGSTCAVQMVSRQVMCLQEEARHTNWPFCSHCLVSC